MKKKHRLQSILWLIEKKKQGAIWTGGNDANSIPNWIIEYNNFCSDWEGASLQCDVKGSCAQMGIEGTCTKSGRWIAKRCTQDKYWYIPNIEDNND